MTTDTLTIADFIMARIDEDEEMAMDGAGWDASGRERSSGRWKRDGLNSVRDNEGRLIIYGDGPAPGDAEVAHIARHDPARVLAQCKAHRAIVELHWVCRVSIWWPEVEAIEVEVCVMCSGGEYDPDEDVKWPCPTLRALAAIWSDHDDYRREEWSACPPTR